jgi:hypothetical protein
MKTLLCILGILAIPAVLAVITLAALLVQTRGGKDWES